jgi:peptide/nickel transport system substrate-binding protein
LRLVVPANDETNVWRDQPPGFLDPQKDFTFAVWELWRCCLTRTLVSHNGHSVEEGGARLHPDLAAALPDVSADGRTWTFTLKPGLHYGPPLQDVEITAQDFVRSFHRLFAPDLNGIWFDFSDIEGGMGYQAGTAASISGIEAPDKHTLVIRLTQALGDFGARLAEPAAAPLPPDPFHPDAAFGAAEGANDDYGSFLVSTGPYMLEGSDALDLSVPAAERRPVTGVAPGKVVLVRNPSWDPGTDALRPAFADRIEITLVDSMESAVAALDSGKADVLYNTRTPPQVPPDLFAAFQADPARGQVHTHGVGSVRGLIMNLAIPPFDDIHVRKALNLVIDKQALVDLQGGPAAAEVFGHIAPDAVEDGLLLDYDPYATPPHHGDLAAAMKEMAQSRYDSDHDGRCDAAVCDHIRATAREAFAATARAARDQFAALGVGLDVEVLPTEPFFDSYGNATLKTAMWLGIGFFNPYIGAQGFFTPFDGRLAISDEAQNGTLIGATPEQLKGWGYDVTSVPNVDARVEACIPLVGPAQFQCWASLDQYLMEEVVPWVPYDVDRSANLTTPRVVSYAFDTLMQTVALDQVALKP